MKNFYSKVLKRISHTFSFETMVGSCEGDEVRSAIISFKNFVFDIVGSPSDYESIEFAWRKVDHIIANTKFGVDFFTLACNFFQRDAINGKDDETIKKMMEENGIEYYLDTNAKLYWAYKK